MALSANYRILTPQLFVPRAFVARKIRHTNYPFLTPGFFQNSDD